MVTLEDLEGSVQILCMNENYDKYRELARARTKRFSSIGEVNTGDDKPKIFPQEIMPLEDAPRKFTKQVHFRLHTGRIGAGEHAISAGTGRGASGQMPVVPLLQTANRRNDFHRNAREIFGRPLDATCSKPPMNILARDLLRQSGHVPARTHPAPLGEEGRFG